jgi:hypothetical protein
LLLICGDEFIMPLQYRVEKRTVFKMMIEKFDHKKRVESPAACWLARL